MKAVFVILCILISPTSFFSQSQGRSSEPLKLEWKAELQIPMEDAQLTDLIIGGNKLYYSMRGKDGSGIFAHDLNGQVPEPIVENSFIQNLNYINGKLFTMGGCQLIRRNAMAIPELEFCLQLQENWTLSAVEGRVAGTTAYGLHWANMLAAYDLNGELKWSKEIAELTQNQFLQFGGNYLYVYCQINKPSLGFRLMQYDTLGNQKWSIAQGNVNNILADKDGNCYVFIVQPQTSNIVNKYDTEGELIWSKVVPGQAIGNGFIFGDSLFVCGIEAIDAANGQLQNSAFSILSASSGEILHQQKIDLYPPDQSAEHFTQIASDGRVIYLGGQTLGENKKSFLVKLSREGNTTGLKDAEATKTSFNIFPNPGGSKFTISCGESKVSTLQVTVRNIAGQVVHDRKINCNADKSFTLDLGKQAAGNYTVEIGEGKDKVVKKLIVE